LQLYVLIFCCDLQALLPDMAWRCNWLELYDGFAFSREQYAGGYPFAIAALQPEILAASIREPETATDNI
jgi:hypothetical protein